MTEFGGTTLVSRETFDESIGAETHERLVCRLRRASPSRVEFGTYRIFDICLADVERVLSGCSVEDSAAFRLDVVLVPSLTYSNQPRLSHISLENNK